jgi:hypothetical protein
MKFFMVIFENFRGQETSEMEKSCTVESILAPMILGETRGKAKLFLSRSTFRKVLTRAECATRACRFAKGLAVPRRNSANRQGSRIGTNWNILSAGRIQRPADEYEKRASLA